jgi:aminopeptidase N
MNRFLLIIFFNIPVFLLAQENDVCPHRKSAFVMSEEAPGYHPLEDKYDVKYYHIDLNVTDKSMDISGITRILISIKESTDTLVFELSDQMIIDSTLINNAKSDFLQSDNKLFILADRDILENEEISVKIFYSSPEGYAPADGLFRAYDFTYGKYATYTLSEPFGASYWFPVKQKLSDKADSVSVWITTDSTLMAGSNGLLTEITPLQNHLHRFEWHSNYPIAYYLISFSVANYIDYSFYIKPAESDDSILIQNFIYNNGNILQKEKDKIDKTADLIKLFSEVYGLYPFSDEKYGHSMAALGGGMEHQTMTTLQSFSFNLVAHELAHQWFGDNVTCGSWQDIWINEGFASYSEYIALEKLVSLQAANDWIVEAHDYAISQPKGSVYLDEDEAKSVRRIFSFALSYKKGAAIIHMLRHEINNDDDFFDIMRQFQTVYADTVATAREFLGVVNDVTGNNYQWFFDQWYFGSGYPFVNINWKSENDSLIIESSQTGSSTETPFFRMHIDFQIEFFDGSDTIFTFLQDTPEERFSISLPKKVENIIADPENHLLKVLSIYESFLDVPEIDIFPNPFFDVINIEFKNVTALKTIFITDIQGKLVYHEDFKTSSLQLNLSNLNQGMYILGITMSGKTFSKRIVKLPES